MNKINKRFLYMILPIFFNVLPAKSLDAAAAVELLKDPAFKRSALALAERAVGVGERALDAAESFGNFLGDLRSMPEKLRAHEHRLSEIEAIPEKRGKGTLKDLIIQQRVNEEYRIVIETFRYNLTKKNLLKDKYFEKFLNFPEGEWHEDIYKYNINNTPYEMPILIKISYCKIPDKEINIIFKLTNNNGKFDTNEYQEYIGYFINKKTEIKLYGDRDIDAYQISRTCSIKLGNKIGKQYNKWLEQDGSVSTPPFEGCFYSLGDYQLLPNQDPYPKRTY
jgi:hypothetical protein